MPFRLRQPLGASYPADGRDVVAAKSALSQLGDYTAPHAGKLGPGFTEWTDDALFDGLKRFQKKNGLRVDGIAKPGGPTETVLSAALADKAQGGAGTPLGARAQKEESRDPPGKGRTSGKAPKRKQYKPLEGLIWEHTAKPARAPAQAQARQPAVFGLAGSVGPGEDGRGGNRGADVTGAIANPEQTDSSATTHLL